MHLYKRNFISADHLAQAQTLARNLSRFVLQSFPMRAMCGPGTIQDAAQPRRSTATRNLYAPWKHTLDQTIVAWTKTPQQVE